MTLMCKTVEVLVGCLCLTISIFSEMDNLIRSNVNTEIYPSGGHKHDLDADVNQIYSWCVNR